VEAVLAEQLDKLNMKLKRLYGLYGDSGDDALLEAIGDVKAEIGREEALLHDEREKNRYVSGANFALDRLEGLEDVWRHLSPAEQRSIIASVIEDITIRDNSVEVKLKYGLTA